MLKFTGLIICFALYIWPSLSFAFYEVHDTENIYETGAVLSEAKTQYDELVNQFNTLQQQYQAVTGQYGWGTFQNSSSDEADREYAPADWQSALNLSGGNQNRLSQLLAEYQQAHATMQSNQYAQGADTNLAQSYTNQVQTNQASATITTYEFNDIDQHLKNLYTLSQQLETAQNSDLKSAVDLNSRIEIEIGYISLEEVRMQTLLNQQEAQNQSSQIVNENEASEYNQAGVSS